jgi:signal peptidase
MLTLTWRGLQAILWIVLIGFVALVGLSRFTPYEALVVRSGSMEPTINTGGIVVVDRGARSPNVGAIASFREPDGAIVTHRIVDADSQGFVTRGDANNSVDASHRPRMSVYGTVVMSMPFVGYLIRTLQQPAAFLLLLVGSGGLLILAESRTILQELQRLRRHPELGDAD